MIDRDRDLPCMSFTRTETTVRKSRSRTVARVVGMAILGFAALGGGYLGAQQLTGNFHTVVDGAFYRSGQLSAGQIDRYADQYGIRTIVNLRGDWTGQEFYDAEVAEARKLDIDHIDFQLSASTKLTSEQVATLTQILRTARKPILVHCKNGADRAGLASALYLLTVDGKPPSVAEEQLSIVYGHFGFPGFPSYPMDETLDAVVAGGAGQTALENK